jgi:hypothetical protein
MKIVPKAGFDIETGDSRPMTAKERQCKNSEVAFGKILRSSKCYCLQRSKQKLLYYFSPSQVRLKISKQIWPCPESTDLI